MPFCSSLTLSLFMCDSGNSLHTASTWQRRVSAAAGPGGQAAEQPAAPACHTGSAKPGSISFYSASRPQLRKYREKCFCFLYLLQYHKRTKVIIVKYIYGKIIFISTCCHLILLKLLWQYFAQKYSLMRRLHEHWKDSMEKTYCKRQPSLHKLLGFNLQK